MNGEVCDIVDETGDIGYAENVTGKRMHDTCDYFREEHEHGQFNKFNVIAMNHRLIPSPKLKFEDILEDSGSVLKNFTDPANHIDLILMGKNNIGWDPITLDFINTGCKIKCRSAIYDF